MCSNPRFESASSYSFIVPDFGVSDSAKTGEDFKILVDSVFSVLRLHLDMTRILLDDAERLPDEVSEIIRVASGYTDLLLRKRMSQFSKQLDSYLMPTADAKLTTLNDLIGLWALIDFQLDDIRRCFEQVENCRLAGWRVPEKELI